MLCLHEQKQMFNEVLDQVISRAQSCKAKILSQGSRITLVKSVLASIPTYTASTFQKTFVPKLILVLGNLLGVTPSVDKNSFFPMSWTKICKPKDCGGFENQKVGRHKHCLTSQIGIGYGL